MSAECSAGNIPPGYKQTEVGVIPEDWDTATLSQHCSKLNVGFVGVCEPYYTSESNGVMLIRTGNLYGQKFKFQDLKYVTHSFHELNKKSQTRKGDILIARHGSSGSAVLVPSSIEEANTLNIVIIRTIANELDNIFAQYAINSDGVKKQVLEVTAGSTQGVINTGEIAKLIIPKPTINEQHAIAEALSDTDALIESLEQLIAKKRQIKQGAMQELLTGKRRLPGFSGEWKVKLLDDLFDFSGGLSASRDQLSMEGYCYLHYGDIHTSKKNFIDVRSEQQDIPKLNISLKKVASPSLLNDGDVVFVDASEDDEGTSRHIVVFNKDKIPFISGLHTIVAKSKKNELDKQYLRYCFQTDDVKKQFYFFAVGTKVSGISKTNIVKITLPVPSLSEQAAIAAILSDMDSEITALEEKLAKARQIKQGMMQELLTGRIRLV
ncbi:Type I restriction-modification system, specificity subunit S [Methanosarcina sp. Kolksee]|uniref:restriction endonuclease subunit S n=1 Tax=Methanosarcina sp. Kolksee TaxID=1434099 RepID=UPI0006154AF1|nr:restriction endonuclease subunit S [Methanosarcina sp. Kolksee]AKB46757.1 Type I restriction-modification system, specificity subunit S [Methanosarcina sp. Kolksee]